MLPKTLIAPRMSLLIINLYREESPEKSINPSLNTLRVPIVAIGGVISILLTSVVETFSISLVFTHLQAQALFSLLQIIC